MKTLGEQMRAGHIQCGWYRVADLLRTSPVPGILKPAYGSEQIDEDFCAMSMADAITTSETGWIEGAEVALNHPRYAEVFAQAEAPSVTFGYNDSEGEVTWDRLLTGSDQYLSLPTITQGITKGCRVIVSVVASCGIKQDAMLQRAVDVAAGIAQLEQRRITTELWCVSPYLDNASSYAFRLHQTGDLLNLAKVAFWCGHPALLRRIVFALQERASADVQRKIGMFYGRPGNLSKTTLATLALPPFEGDTLLIPTLQSNNVETTRKAILAAFNKSYERLADSTHDDSGVIVAD